MHLIGNTVELSAYPKDGENNPVNVTNPSIIIYDYDRNIVDTIESANIDNPAMGEYKCFYTIPNGLSYLSYEFKGDIGGVPFLERIKIPRKWVRD